MALVLVMLLAASLPSIDITSACHVQERGLPTDQRGAAYKDCVQVEQAAAGELRTKWTQFPATARQPCADLAPTFDSYVELLTCVEIRTGSGPQATNRK